MTVGPRGTNRLATYLTKFLRGLPNDRLRHHFADFIVECSAREVASARRYSELDDILSIILEGERPDPMPLELYRRGRPEDVKRNATISKMLNAGRSWSGICDATGCSRTTVARVARRD